MNNKKIKNVLLKSPKSVKRILRYILVTPLRHYIRYAPFSFGKKLFWDLGAEHFWWLEKPVKVKTVFGNTMHVDASDIVGKYIYYFGIWEPCLSYWLKKSLSSGDTFIDVGANIGYFSILASNYIGETGKIVSIEALPQIYNVLQCNIKENNIINVRSVNIAAWHLEESIKIFTDVENPPGCTTTNKDLASRWNLTDAIEVPAEPLSTILTPEEINAARVIKIDVEGAEWRVLHGMLPILDSCRDDLEIVMEINHKVLAKEGKTCKDIFELFNKYGYQPYGITNDYSVASYLQSIQATKPIRMKEIPENRWKDMDVIFSRIDNDDLKDFKL